MSNGVSDKAESVIAALGEDIRPAVQTLEQIFHKYDIGDATGCVYCIAERGDK
jgi:hypothetical protein